MRSSLRPYTRAPLGGTHTIGRLDTRIRPDAVGAFAALVMCFTVAVLAWPPLARVVPEGLLIQAQRNNEAFFFVALVIALLPAWGRASIPLSRLGVAAMAAFFVVFDAIGPSTGLPIWVITLNESLLGAVVLFAYLVFSGYRRPQTAKWFYLVLAAVVLAGELPIPGWGDSAPAWWIVNHAEGWGFALLAAIYLDFVRPWPFERDKTAGVVGRGFWYVGIVVTPLLFSALNEHGVDSTAAVGPYESTLVWVQRITEAFVAAVLITVYYGWRAREHRAESEATEHPTR